MSLQNHFTLNRCSPSKILSALSLTFFLAHHINGHCDTVLAQSSSLNTSSNHNVGNTQGLEYNSTNSYAEKILYQNSEYEMNFFSSFLAKKWILWLNWPVNQELQNISHLIRVPISSYLYNDALSGKQYTSDELTALQVNLWGIYSQQLQIGKMPFWFKDWERLGYQEGDNPAQIHSQKSFGNLIVWNYAMDGAKDSKTLVKKYWDTDEIQRIAAKSLHEIIAWLPSEYKKLLWSVCRIFLLPTTLPHPMSINTWNFSLVIWYDALLDNNISILDKQSILIHELAHLKHFLIMFHEQQEWIQNTIWDRLNRILWEKTPNFIRINDDSNRDILFFWLDDIPQEIKRKLWLNWGIDYTLDSSSLENLTNEESNTLKWLEVNLTSWLSKWGFIHPYSKEKYKIPWWRWLFWHLRLSENEYMEYISTTVEFYYSNQNRFINVWYKSDEKLREIVDTVLIPHWFINDFRSKLPNSESTS